MAKERNPFVSFFGVLVKIAIAIVGVFLLFRFLVGKRSEWAGLSESQARAKMEEKLSGWMGEEKASEVADQVVPFLKDKGLLDPVSDETAKAKKVADDVVDAVKDAASEVADKVKDGAGDVAAAVKEISEEISKS